MCGISGYIRFNGGIEGKRAVLESMCDVISHRGPDDSGLYLEDTVGFGHRRLSIIDLGGGKQPMRTNDGALCIVFNGEIYNFLELRDELKRKGFVFNTESDTEVILHGYRAYGTKVLEKLNGMFAFAIWDASHKRLFAARDRLGKKPFYYHADKDKFLFSSEMKSILAEPEIAREIDFGAVNKYFSYGYIPAPDTIFKGIRKLRPGHFLILENEKVTVTEYWDVRYSESGDCKTEDDFADKLQELLQESVRARLISDVPLGAFLSGGLDSSAIVGTMASLTGGPVESFTIGFEEAGFSELVEARRLAAFFKTNHHEFTVKADAISMLPKLVWHFDEPFGDSSALPTFYVSQMARKGVTVVLSGDGGDEIFAGYNHYNWYKGFKGYTKVPSIFRKGLIGPLGHVLPIHAKAKNLLIGIGQAEKIGEYNFAEIFPLIKENIFSPWLKSQIAQYADPLESRLYWNNAPKEPLISRMQYLDTKVYLPEDILMKVDRMSMANGLETRAPLLDYRLVEFAATIPPEMQTRDGKGKYLFRKAVSRFLPKEVLEKKKQGFAIPRQQWFKGELKAFAKELLTSERFRSRGYFQADTVEKMLAGHSEGTRDYSHWIWCLINFEIWHRTFIDVDTRRI
jgi:asparagine synthase (glutamine-hydrolysing)